MKLVRHNYLRSIMLACALSTGVVLAADPPLTPAQAAYLRAELRKANDKFVARVAEVTQLKQSDVAKEIPEQGRLTDPVARLIERVERRAGKPLTEEQKVQIQAADSERVAAHAVAEAAAKKK